MTLNEMKEKLIKLGAQQRLSELNKERDVLLNLLGRSDDDQKKKDVLNSVKSVKKNKKHWTKTPEGRAHMSRIMKAKYAAGWKSNRSGK
jgi:hypothetical protein